MQDRSVPSAAPDSWQRVGRGAAVIVVTGLVLGLGFNQLGLASRPARGLAWIAQPVATPPSLETLLAANPTPAPEGTAAVPAPVPAEPRPEPVAETRKAPAPVKHPAPSPPPARAAAAAAPSRAVADPDDPLGGSLGAAAGDGLPEIPDLDRPFSVELAIVRKFVEAHAALVLDAREPDEYAAGHIPGALNIPYDTAGSDPAKLEKLDSGGRPIIVYCGGGTCEVSMRLAETLIYQFAKRKVLVYMGGWPDWAASGLPVEKGSGAGGAGR